MQRRAVARLCGSSRASPAGAVELWSCCPRCGTNKQTRAAAPLTPRQCRHPSPSRQISAIFPKLLLSKASLLSALYGTEAYLHLLGGGVQASVLPQEGRSRWVGGGRVGKQLTVLLRDPTQDCLPGRHSTATASLCCTALLCPLPLEISFSWERWGQNFMAE